MDHLSRQDQVMIELKQALSGYLSEYEEIDKPPLRNVLHKTELSGCLAKWAVKVNEFSIEYKLKSAIKSQILADFVANFSAGLMSLADKEAMLVSVTVSAVWTLFMDGSSNVKSSGLGVVLITPSGEPLRQSIRTVPLTNTEANYEALVVRLELDRGLGFKVIEIKCDSQLVVNQLYRIIDTREERIQQYLNMVQVLLSRFREWSIIHILREEYVEVDALANLGSSTKIKVSDVGALVQLLHSVLDVAGYYEANSTNLIWD
ncbi:uncharacterized protein [Nicotiana sylvestris]|uniref:uncharacterized protein n=1 Tax=Nicotiana sylvestris TaxID=4096 RepID=UPI00388CDCDE